MSPPDQELKHQTQVLSRCYAQKALSLLPPQPQSQATPGLLLAPPHRPTKYQLNWGSILFTFSETECNPVKKINDHDALIPTTLNLRL